MDPVHAHASFEAGVGAGAELAPPAIDRRGVPARPRLRVAPPRGAEIVAIDYLDAPGRQGAEGVLDAIARALPTRSGEATASSLEVVARPRAATWVTRTGVHVDRIASAWLIRRFIDPQARLKF